VRRKHGSIVIPTYSIHTANVYSSQRILLPRSLIATEETPYKIKRHNETQVKYLAMEHMVASSQRSINKKYLYNI
jgi:hypothetical protein